MSWCKRIICASFVVLFALWIGLSPRCSPGLYNDKLFRPDLGNGAPHDFNEMENREVFFATADGGTLHGWIYLKPGSDKIILVHPGNAGDIANRLYLTRLLLEGNVSVFQYEPRGFGKSSATELSPETICEDGLAAYDYLVHRLGYKPQQIVLYGMSLGASVATYVSSERPTAAIVLHSPFASLERIAKENMPILKIYPWWLFPTPRLDNVDILEEKHPPLLLLHGEKDELIPISHSEELASRAAEPKTFVRFPRSGHSSFDPDDIKTFVAAMKQFLEALP